MFVGQAQDSSNTSSQVYVLDNQTGQTMEASVSSSGVEGSGLVWGGGSSVPVISSNGQYVAFASYSTNLVSPAVDGSYSHIYVHNLITGETSLISASSSGAQANAGSGRPMISADGRYIVYNSNASNLVSDDTNAAPDVFMYDNFLGNTTRVSVSSRGEQATGNSNSLYSYATSMTTDGRYITFHSTALNLVSGITRVAENVYIRDRDTKKVALVNVPSDSNDVCGASNSPRISPDGRYIVYSSNASNIFPGDTTCSWDEIVTANPLFGLVNQLPVANAGPSQAVISGSTVSLNASGSTDLDGDYPLTYNWSLASSPSGSTAAINDPASSTPSFIADVAGDYVISLVVTDSLGLSSGPTIVTIHAINIINLSDTNLWVGLLDTQDQGAKFDFRAELYLNGSLISSGQDDCIDGLIKDKIMSMQIAIPFSQPVLNTTLMPDDDLSLKIMSRMGTDDNRVPCSNISSTSGVRLYYDGASSPSSFGISTNLDPLVDYFLTFNRGEYILSDQTPDGNLRHVDSAPISYDNGNPWVEVGNWNVTL